MTGRNQADGRDPTGLYRRFTRGSHGLRNPRAPAAIEKLRSRSFTVARGGLQASPILHYIPVQKASHSQPMGTIELKALKMLKNAASELREVVWLASVVGGLSVVGVSLAVAAVVALERLSTIAHV